MKMENYQELVLGCHELAKQLQEAAAYLNRCVVSLSEVLPSQGAVLDLQHKMNLEAELAKLKVLFDSALFREITEGMNILHSNLQ